MNKDRRQEIAALIARVTSIVSKIESLTDDIENVRDEEQDYFDNMPESIQSGDKGDAAEAAIGSLDEALSALEDFDGSTVVSSLESAAE